MTLVRAVTPELVPRQSPDRFTIHGEGHLRVSLGVLGGDCCPWPRERVSSSGGLAGDEAADWDIVEEWGRQSFPASDPPANW